MAIDRLVVGCHDFVLSQAGEKMTGRSNLSHPNYELDICCEDSGISFWWNKLTETYWKCAAKWGTSNTRFFWSCDKYGNPKKVRLPNGHDEYVTLAFTHDNNPVAVGTIIPPGGVIAKEGTAGIATGNHMHLEIAIGRQSTKVRTGKYIYGQEIYAMPNQIDPRNALWIWDGFTKRSSTLGLTFKHCSEVSVKEETANTSTSSAEGIDMAKLKFYAYSTECIMRNANGTQIGVIPKGAKVPVTGFMRAYWNRDNTQHCEVNYNGKVGYVQMDFTKGGYMLISE